MKHHFPNELHARRSSHYSLLKPQARLAAADLDFSAGGLRGVYLGHAPSVGGTVGECGIGASGPADGG